MFFRKLRCSFCRRDNDHVEKLVAGARGYICDRCAHEVMRIITETPPAPDAQAPKQPVVLPRTSEVGRTWHFAVSSR